MRLIIKSLCKCLIIDKDPKNNLETVNQGEETYGIEIEKKQEFDSSVFCVRETRQKSVDYIVSSPKFGGNSPKFVICTGGTENNPNFEG